MSAFVMSGFTDAQPLASRTKRTSGVRNLIPAWKAKLGGGYALSA
jgi:hypothetical protein